MIAGLYLRLAGAAAIIALLAGAYWWIDDNGYVRGEAKVNAQWVIAKQAAADQRDAEITRLTDKHAADKAKLKQDGANEITAVRAKYAAAGGLRIHKNICAGFAPAAATDSASRSDAGTAAAGLLPEPYNTHIKQLMQEADELVAACRVAQHFITSINAAP